MVMIVVHAFTFCGYNCAQLNPSLTSVLQPTIADDDSITFNNGPDQSGIYLSGGSLSYANWDEGFCALTYVLLLHSYSQML